MKNTVYKYVLGALILLGGIFAFSGSAHAFVGFNDNVQGPDDPTLQVSNATTNPNCSSCWLTSTSGNPGDTISVDLYYHNTGDSTATNVIFKLFPTSTPSQSNHLLSGSVTAANSLNTSTGSVNVGVNNSAQTLTFVPGSVRWYPNQGSAPVLLPFGQTGNEIVTGGGLTIGNLAPGWPTQGHIVAHYLISGTPAASYACNDGIDNDGDSLIDYPADPGCSSPTDNDETNGPAAGQIPTMTTNAATNVGSNKARLNGAYDMHGSMGTVWFEYDTNTSFSNWTSSIVTTTSVGSYFMNISNLDECTTYYFRAVGQNAYGTGYGGTRTFQTDCVGTNDFIDARTSSATSVNNTSAKLNGSYNSSGNLGTIRTWFEYGTSSGNLSNQTSSQNNNNTSDSLSQTISGLIQNTTYYYRFCASSSKTGTDCGSTVSFVTGTAISGNLSATTTVATSIGRYSAVLNGFISNQTGLTANASFEYGTTTNFTQSTQFQTIGGNNQTPIAAYISGLTPNTTYYFRAVAQTSNGIASGSIASFRTLQATSTVVYVNPTPAPKVLTLQIVNTMQTVMAGDEVCYTVFYTNTSAKALSNAVLTVKLPNDVAYKNSSAGYLAGDSVVYTIGTIPAHGSGVLVINGKAKDSIVDGETLVTTATMTYALSNGTQDSVIAYATQIGSNPHIISEDANLGGHGFFPSNLLGWLILIAALIIIILLIRRFSYRGYHGAPPPPRH